MGAVVLRVIAPLRKRMLEAGDGHVLGTPARWEPPAFSYHCVPFAEVDPAVSEERVGLPVLGFLQGVCGLGRDAVVPAFGDRQPEGVLPPSESVFGGLGVRRVVTADGFHGSFERSVVIACG